MFCVRVDIFLSFVEYEKRICVNENVVEFL